MTTAEMNRRLLSLTEADRLRLYRMVCVGYGAHGIYCESRATRKQINAVFEWWERYNSVLPTDGAICPL